MTNTIEHFFSKLNIYSLYKAFEKNIDPIAITDANWEDGIKFIYVNPAFSQATGYSIEELLGQSPKILQGENSNYNVLQSLKEQLQVGNDFTGQSVNYRKDGSEYFVKWSISHLQDQLNKTIGYISFQKVLDKTIKIENEKLLCSIVEHSQNLVLATDLNGIIVYVNNAFTKKLGYTREELIGQHTRILKSGRQNESFYKKMWEQLIRYGQFKAVFESKTKNGKYFYDEKHISTIKDNNHEPIYYVSISKDITDLKIQEAFLEEKIYTDTLTKVFNREKFNIDLENRLNLFQQSGESFTLVLIDIDYFKKINDNYGHSFGDFTLVEISNVILGSISKKETLYRWGGEEFAILSSQNKNEVYNTCEVLKEKNKAT